LDEEVTARICPYYLPADNKEVKSEISLTGVEHGTFPKSERQ